MAQGSFDDMSCWNFRWGFSFRLRRSVLWGSVMWPVVRSKQVWTLSTLKSAFRGYSSVLRSVVDGLHEFMQPRDLSDMTFQGAWMSLGAWSVTSWRCQRDCPDSREMGLQGSPNSRSTRCNYWCCWIASNTGPDVTFLMYRHITGEEDPGRLVC